MKPILLWVVKCTLLLWGSWYKAGSTVWLAMRECIMYLGSSMFTNLQNPLLLYSPMHLVISTALRLFWGSGAPCASFRVARPGWSFMIGAFVGDYVPNGFSCLILYISYIELTTIPVVSFLLAIDISWNEKTEMLLHISFKYRWSICNLKFFILLFVAKSLQSFLGGSVSALGLHAKDGGSLSSWPVWSRPLLFCSTRRDSRMRLWAK